MGAHNTKDKGDLGTAMAYADLVSQGCMVLFPATEHASYYVRPGDHNEVVTLRVAPARNGQQIGVRLASQFRRLPV